jgi:hypothetical protein
MEPRWLIPIECVCTSDCYREERRRNNSSFDESVPRTPGKQPLTLHPLDYHALHLRKELDLVARHGPNSLSSLGLTGKSRLLSLSSSIWISFRFSKTLAY